MSHFIAIRILASVLLLSGLATAADDAPDSAFSRLVKKYDQRVKVWAEATDKAEGDAAQIARHASYPLWEFAPRMVELATQATDPDEAVSALIWVTKQAGSVGANDRRFAPSDKRALELLMRDHCGNAEFGPLCLSVAKQPSPAREQFLRTVLERPTNIETRALATFGLAEVLSACREMHFSQRVMPRSEQPLAVYFNQNRDAAFSEWVQTADPQKLFIEAEALLEQIRSEHAVQLYRLPSAETPPGAFRGQKLGELSERRLFELRNLSPDRIVPDVVGTDLDGRPFSMAQYRGKVVVISFWFAGCGPCLAAMKEERKLLEGMRDRPLVMLGVNTDEELELAQRTAAAHGATWPSLWDHEKQLANRWNVSSYPTTYVINHEGKIVVRGDPRGTSFATLIEQLVKDAEARSR